MKKAKSFVKRKIKNNVQNFRPFIKVLNNFKKSEVRKND